MCVQEKQCVPQTTLEDMHLWAYGFIGFAEEFFEEFKEDAALFLMPARFCQDSLENMFGMIRQGGGTANNPTVLQAAKGAQLAQQRKELKSKPLGGSSSYKQGASSKTARSAAECVAKS
jgi:hypothetical protein